MAIENDRELLEMAAKAAGIVGTVGGLIGGGHYIANSAAHMGMWSPLTDDGDALRLAAALRLHIKPGKHLGDGCTVETQRTGIAGCTAFYDDKAEQMRRAIVSAAAQIGVALADTLNESKGE